MTNKQLMARTINSIASLPQEMKRMFLTRAEENEKKGRNKQSFVTLYEEVRAALADL